MTNEAAPPGRSYASLVCVVALSFCALTSAISYARWANFEFRTFDLAFYVQALWQLLHGRFDVSLLRVPLLGNHVEPIVFLITPIFAVFRHPMTLVVVQNALLATMGPVAYRIGARLGFAPRNAALLAIALVLAPATWFIALHEFHPEAIAAPFLLLLLHARLRGSLSQHWLCFVAVLACKENMALLLAPYCAIHLVLERKRPLGELRAWYLWPLLASLIWFVVATKVILPSFNQGNVDYLALYDRLGSTPAEIIRHAVTQPWRYLHALTESLSHGNLLPALLLPFLALPLLRPRWLLICTPILLQHLLSWRSSEWMIYFHYGAPLIPLFWIATAEATAGLKRRLSIRPWHPATLLCAAVAGACVVAQIYVGPAASMVSTATRWSDGAALRYERNEMLARIGPSASVIAALPYLAHLAERPQIYSLHHVLKGLRTLSRAAYQSPAPTDFVLIDYSDSATFDISAGFYHPTMKTQDGRVIPSSDRLLHEVLKQRSWRSRSSNELTLLQQIASPPSSSAAPLPSAGPIAIFGAHTRLLAIDKSSDELSPGGEVTLHLQWLFEGDREVFPWMELLLTPVGGGRSVRITRGLCAPEAVSGSFAETWQLTARDLPTGDYFAQVFFYDQAKRQWSQMSAPVVESPPLCPALPLGQLKVKR